MKEFFRIFLSIIVAFLLYTLLGKISVSLLLLVNFFSLVVIYFALEKGEIYGACLGTCCGLLQDSFSLGVFGVAGISKTIMGFLAGYVSGKINLTSVKRNFIFVLALLFVDLLIWGILYSFIFSEKVDTRGGMIFFQPVITALIWMMAYRFIFTKKQMKI